ncbi:FAD-dependent oxidoreductase [Microcoleus sp. FACHB-672]|uniref:FAD-dependent oxidoreductase n=1 Tax=Microcoleus sp. FACHB-672 TaxID=2692825 RepID=UPI001689FC14|nr:FAD-binding oxidoreductase [Microcoleus sp. FACHB-672]MBD2042164.1 FAD-binding oxidoreductase [Microcoleus sp. FACHB-672]
MSQTEQILSQLPGDALGALRRADSLWQAIKEGSAPVPAVVKQNEQPLETVEWDIVIAGGTLGIFIGAALAQRGWRVALVERGILRGRDQEWNISRKELDVFVELDLLSEAELGQAIATEYNPARVSFLNGAEVWVRDVLNIGVDPVSLLDTLKLQFLEAGGQLFENTAFEAAIVHPDGITVEIKSQAEDSSPRTLTTRLFIDAMGHFSPVIRQARQGQKPDSICLVVGSCARGFPQNETGDLFVSFTPIQHQCQYFWEAFPARDGRTTYLFTYLDADPQRFSLEFLFEEYLRLLPAYQGVEIDQLEFQRALFGFFPSYRQSPLQMPWSRILPVGDSSGSQSPLSFGGFGAMVRHLKRLTTGIEEALQADTLSAPALALLQPYQPSLSVTWLFQRAMTVGIERKIEPEQINQLLSGVFAGMEQLGEPVLKPFLQDVVQFSALSQTLLKTAINNPALIIKLTPQLGLIPLLDWMRHYINLGVYSALFPLGQAMEPFVKTLSPAQQYYYHRWLDAWIYGSAGDY